MRVLFVLNTPGFLRYFDVTIDALLKRGHDVMLAFTRPDLRPESLEIYRGQKQVPQVLGETPARDDEYAHVARSVRAAVDYLRYLDPDFRDAEYLRARRRGRAFQYAPWTRIFLFTRSLPRPIVRRMIATLLAFERAIPSAKEVEAYLKEVGPDVLLVSPLVTGASPQTDLVKSARRLGIPCAVCIASWDNLTNKGLIREHPDQVIVWNDVQRREAVELHGVAADRVVVTGAQPFDRWFGRLPSCSRSEFLERVGLPTDRSYVMFVGSTSNIAREGVEEAFVRKWIGCLRASRGSLADVGVLVRPHPDRRGAWESINLDGLKGVTIWPPRKPNSVLAEARTDYFDSLYHSSAVVGINTSAMIEAAIIGRPVLTIRTNDFVEAQQGTMHFRYLLPENGGFLVVARTLEEHLQQLRHSLDDPSINAREREQFVRSFIRPRGISRQANDVLVETIERLPSIDRLSAPSTSATARGFLTVAARYGRWRQARTDPEALRIRLHARTRRLRLRASRLSAASRPLGISLAVAAAAHERWSSFRVRLASYRSRLAHAREPYLKRKNKQRSRELLARSSGEHRS
jgi:hypothetical protein